MREDLHTLLEMVGTGKLKVLVDRTCSLDDAAVALSVIEDRKVFGKVVVTP